MSYRSVFSSAKGQLRHKKKKIRKVVLANGGISQDLVKEFGLEKVVDILRYLLGKGVFRSELEAKLEFPELFESESSRTIRRAASEDEAARSESEALDAIDADAHHIEGAGEVLPLDDRQLQGRATSSREHENNTQQDVVSLYPSYVPYKTQHLVLTTVQRMLEECCFDFSKMWISDALQERKWDCAEAAELTQWLSLLNRRSGKIPAHAFTRQFSSIQGILSSVRRLRHTAVHRLPITARGTCDLIQSAAKLSEVLRDPFRTAQLEAIAQTLGPLTRDMELHKNFLENTLDVNLQTIRQQREELDRREAALIAMTRKEDADKKALVGSMLEEAVRKIIQIPLSREHVPDEDTGAFEEISSGGETC